MTPGQSKSLTCLSNFIYCSAFVHPGMLETSQALVLFKLLITLLLPTLGYPISPTVTALVDPYTLESCLISCTKCSAPIALFEWIRVSAISLL